MIGVDPHKLSHTAVAIGGGEDELAMKKVRATKNQVTQLLAWAEAFPTRTWAIESAYGLGFLLAQQLIKASDVHRFLATVSPASPVEQVRFDLAVELLDEIERLDDQLNGSHRRLRDAVRASNTTVTDIYGVGPALAACHHRLQRRHRPVRQPRPLRRLQRHGTAPREVSSGGRRVHRLSRHGNRRLNHAIHMVAMSQISHRGTDGRAYFERRVAEGKTKREAIRSLKRHISNGVYQQLLVDAHRGR